MCAKPANKRSRKNSHSTDKMVNQPSAHLIAPVVYNAFHTKKSNQVSAGDAGGVEANLEMMMDSVNKEFTVQEIFPKLKQISRERKFSESLELILKLNVDPTQGD